jgi:cytoskeleton protein RodZ
MAVEPVSLGREARHGGEVIAQERENRQMSLRELSLRTRIGIRHLEALEAMDRENLPRPLYVRGYLREIARVLELPLESLLERYLRELAGGSKAAAEREAPADEPGPSGG